MGLPLHLGPCFFGNLSGYKMREMKIDQGNTY